MATVFESALTVLGLLLLVAVAPLVTFVAGVVSVLSVCAHEWGKAAWHGGVTLVGLIVVIVLWVAIGQHAIVP